MCGSESFLCIRRHIVSVPLRRRWGWSKDLKGEIGGGLAPFGDKTNGMTYGIAMEIWF